MDFRQLEAFCAIIDCGSFSEAARKLYITQPTISNHLRMLEQELNTTLISRTTKSLTITPEGRRFYDYARSMLKIRNKALHDFNRTKSGRICLAASSVPAAFLMPQLISQYTGTHPEVSFELRREDSMEIINHVLAGMADAGITGAPYTDDELECIPLYQDPMVLVTPDNHRFQQLRREAWLPGPSGKDPASAGDWDLRELLVEPFIMREEGSATRRETLKYLQTQGLSEPQLNICATMNDVQAVLYGVAGGLGISVLSEAVIRKEDALPVLVFPLEADGAPVTRTYFLVFRKNLTQPLVQDFLEFLQKELSRKDG